MRVSRFAYSWVVVALIAMSATAQAGEPPAPQQLLLQMANAEHTLDYKGRFTRQYENGSATFEVVHQVINGVESERLIRLDGLSKEVSRHGHATTCLQTGEKILRNLLNPASVGEFGKLEDHYSFKVTGATRVAGREAWVLSIQPRDALRLGYTLAIDQQTGLWLQNRVHNVGGAVLEQFQFVSLQVGGITPADMRVATQGHVDLEDVCDNGYSPASALAASPWSVDLPQGFVLSLYEKRDAQTDALVFSDGLSSFTLFVSRETMHDVAERRGSTLVHSEQVTLGSQAYTATIVGEVPDATAKSVIESLAAAAPSVHP